LARDRLASEGPRDPQEPAAEGAPLVRERPRPDVTATIRSWVANTMERPLPVREPARALDPPTRVPLEVDEPREMPRSERLVGQRHTIEVGVERRPAVDEVARVAGPEHAPVDVARGSGEQPVTGRPSPTPSAIAPRHEALAQVILARATSLPRSGVELSFELSPPELGPLRIRIAARGAELRVELVAQSQAAVDALVPGVARLTAQLHDAGYPNSQVTVAVDTPGQPGTSAHGGREPSTRHSAHSGAATEEIETGSPGFPDSRTARRLDRLA
jgi:hypothetical protein